MIAEAWAVGRRPGGRVGLRMEV